MTAEKERTEPMAVLDTPPAGVVPDGGDAALYLRVISEGDVVIHALPLDGRVVIGRTEGADVCISHTSISRRHAELQIGDRLFVEDLGSSNGTRVRDEQLVPEQRVEVFPNDTIEFGAVTVVLQYRQALNRSRRIGTVRFLEEQLLRYCVSGKPRQTEFAVASLRCERPIPSTDMQVVLSTHLPADAIIAVIDGFSYDILMPQFDRDQASRAVQQVRNDIAERGGSVVTAIACFPKDAESPEQLLAFLRQRRPTPRLTDDQKELRAHGTLVVESAAMQRIFRLVERVAPANVSVLLLGETGVGKDVLAEWIHAHSPRAGKLFVRLNCGALPETMLESELFGHERGAFTGAAREKPGLFETAEGGTVFLDEIGELPTCMQSSLLRVIEDREVLRLGALKPRHVDMRVIAATNRDLAAMVAQGTFREDLYHRLSVIPIVVPPLRQRQEEILPLAEAFVARSVREGGQHFTLSAEARNYLVAHSWPGNVRELRNVIARALLLCDGPSIMPHHFVTDARGVATNGQLIWGSGEEKPVQGNSESVLICVGPEPQTPALAEDQPMGDTGPLRGDIETLEREKIIRALDACGGSQTLASQMLGISRSSLIRRLERYGFPRPRKHGNE